MARRKGIYTGQNGMRFNNSKTNIMKHLHLLLTLSVNLFYFNLEAQNDTAYFEDGSMLIGRNGIKVSIEGGNIVIDGSGINNGFKPGITTGPSTGEGSSFYWSEWPDTSDFVPVDTITRIMPGVCDLPDEELSPGVFRSCGAYHEPEEVKYVVLKNGAGATKEVRLQDDSQLIRVKKNSSRPTNELQKYINGQWQTVNWQ